MLTARLVRALACCLPPACACGHTSLSVSTRKRAQVEHIRCRIPGGGASTRPACGSEGRGCLWLALIPALAPCRLALQNDKSSAAAIHSRAQDDVDGAAGAGTGCAARCLQPATSRSTAVARKYRRCRHQLEVSVLSFSCDFWLAFCLRLGSAGATWCLCRASWRAWSMAGRSRPTGRAL